MIFEQMADDRKVRVFSLSKDFVDAYRGRQPAWGPVGQFTFSRTYARALPEGGTESFWQTCRRVVEGTYNIQKIHCRQMGLPWNEQKAQHSAQDMYERMWAFKFLPPGRGLWVMGTDLVYQRGSAALLNCSFCSTENISEDFAAPFCFLMDMSMLGVGVGGDTRGVGKVRIQVPRMTDEPHIVADSREGWVDVVRAVLNSFVGKGYYPKTIDYSLVRGRGEPIKTFGGTASGPNPLQTLIRGLTKILMPEGVQARFRVLEQDKDKGTIGRVQVSFVVPEGTLPYRISSAPIVDVFNYIGKCLPGDAWVLTEEGPRQVKHLVGKPVNLIVNGQPYPTESQGFFQTGEKQVFKLITEQGWTLRLTKDHRLKRSDGTWVEAGDLRPGEAVVLHEHQGVQWGGVGSQEQGYVLGHLVGDGYIRKVKWGEWGQLAQMFTWDQDEGAEEVRRYTEQVVGALPHRADWVGWRYNGGEGRQVMSSAALTTLAAEFGITKDNKTLTLQVEAASSAFQEGFLRGLFDADGSVNPHARCITLSQSDLSLLQGVQRMLGRLGVLSSIYPVSPSRPGEFVLYIGGIDGERFMDRIGFINTRKAAAYRMKPWIRGPYHREPVAVVKFLEPDGTEPVYDVTVADVHAFDANGLYVHNCVVAGGLRRTAEIMFGEPDDQEFITLKQDKAALEDRRWASNNSVFGYVGMDYSNVARSVAKNGEPGVFWLENARRFSRMNGVEDNKDWRVMGSNPCFAGETLIAVADGRGAVPIQQLADEGKDVPVYSVNDTGKVEIQMARNPRLTREQAPLVEILLDDGTALRVTPDHEMQLLDGSRCLASDLQAGDSLPRLTKRAETFSGDQKYLRLYCDTRDPRKDKIFEHRLIARFHDPEKWDSLYDEGKKSGWVRGGLVVHHRDFDSFNNAPGNLDIMTFRDHQAYHARFTDVAGEKNPMWGKQHSIRTRRKIGDKTKERWTDPAFRRKFDRAITPQMRNARSKRMSTQRQCELKAYYKEQAATTDLKHIWVEGRLYALKECEACGREFPVPWRRREQAYCSVSCGNTKPASIRARRKGRAVAFSNRQRQTLHLQVQHYKDLEQELGRAPSKKEWESRCREATVPIRFRTKGTTKNPYVLTGFKHLKQVVPDYNHRVLDVRVQDTEEPVYNLTVDQNHTVGVVTRFNQVTKECSGVFTFQCGEQPLESFEACVGGDTQIQLKTGVKQIRDLVGQVVQVWNGDSWSTVTPRSTGENRDLFRVTLSDGSFLDCTGNHGWHVLPKGKRVFRRVETTDLRLGSQVVPFEIDAPTEGEFNPVAFEMGLFTGDGFLNRTGDYTYPVVFVLGKKAKLQDLDVQGVWWKPQNLERYTEPVNRLCLHKLVSVDEAERLNDKSVGLTDSVFQMDRESVLEFVAGWIESDGAITNKGAPAEGYRIYGAEPKMRDLQLLLRRVGVDHSTVRLFADEGTETNFGTRNYALWYCQIPSFECSAIPTRIKTLSNIGSRLARNNAHPDGAPIDRARKQKIVKMEEIPGTHTTYCFDEPENHMAVFGNVLTYQCNLVETFPAHHADYDDFQRTLKMAYLFAKTVTLIPTHDLRANAVMTRNRRIGCSMSGIIQAMSRHGRRQFLTWCGNGYEYIQRLDRTYSDWLGVPLSRKTTTVKPSGTTSLLCGAFPGIHYPHSEFYIRNIRVANTSPLVESAVVAGYKVEPDTYADDTSVISFPVRERLFTKGKCEVSIWEQFCNAADMQRHWSDNAVSVTVTFRSDEVRDIQPCLEAFEDQLKGVSMLPLDDADHGYVQPPYQAISQEDYEQMAARISPIDFGESRHEVDDKFCSSDKCDIRR